MGIQFVPQRGQILMCDFDMAGIVPPEMPKVRRVVVVSPRSYNARHANGPGRCVVVPFSSTQPVPQSPAEVAIPAGLYNSLTVPTWAICTAIRSVSHRRLDRVASAGGFLSELMAAVDMARIDAGIRHALGLTL